MQQIIYNDLGKFKSDLGKYLKHKRCLLICSKSQNDNYITSYLKRCGAELTIFNGFSSNPKIEEALLGLRTFYDNNCDFLISMGGGSTIDVAKVIKGLSGDTDLRSLDFDETKIVEILNDPRPDKNILHLAIPTTAGTGSESTHFAVIYYGGVKYSMSDDELLPNYVLFQTKLLATLPEYQKKSTMLDALCQGIESYWSVNSTEESKKYAADAIELILECYQEYIGGAFDKEIASRVLKAANLSGRAINISKTTAAHAMSYKITSLYGLAHGHAVAVCLPWVWEYMLNHMEMVVDKRGRGYVVGVMEELGKMFGVGSRYEAIGKLFGIYDRMKIEYKHVVREKDLDVLVKSVNLQRLGNNPVRLGEGGLRWIYEELV